MSLNSLYKIAFWNRNYKGKYRLFSYLFNKNKLAAGIKTIIPIGSNFQIQCDTNTWIGANIAFCGDYERPLKAIFKKLIKEGDCVVDVGANIGFHTLYFAELVGEYGSVISFEPVFVNFNKLKSNIQLNTFKNITPYNLALGNKKETIYIDIDVNSTNPGAFNLFTRNGTTVIKCLKGDDVIEEKHIDFIKIDVEGYESLVIEGLSNTIKKYRPTIVFEYDHNYHKKTNLPSDHSFKFLQSENYRIYLIDKHHLKKVKIFNTIKSGNYLALPNDK